MQIIDNLGAPLISTGVNFLYYGNLGTIVDIRTNLGSLGSPLIYIKSLSELKQEARDLNINKIISE